MAPRNVCYDKCYDIRNVCYDKYYDDIKIYLYRPRFT